MGGTMRGCLLESALCLVVASHGSLFTFSFLSSSISCFFSFSGLGCVFMVGLRAINTRRVYVYDTNKSLLKKKTYSLMTEQRDQYLFVEISKKKSFDDNLLSIIRLVREP
jgi:hypothetical protein